MLKTIEKSNSAATLNAFRTNDTLALERFVREHRSNVFRQIERMGGTEEEAKDIFQNALVAICLKSQQPDFQLSCSFSTYLFAVCRSLWLKHFRDKKRRSWVSLLDLRELKADEDVQQTIAQYERHVFFMQKISEVKGKCRRLLELAIVEERDTDEIMETLEMESYDYYYKRKSNCKDKLIEMIRQDPRFNEF